MADDFLDALDCAIMDGFGKDVFVNKEAKEEIINFVKWSLKDFIPKASLDKLIETAEKSLPCNTCPKKGDDAVCHACCDGLHVKTISGLRDLRDSQ